MNVTGGTFLQSGGTNNVTGGTGVDLADLLAGKQFDDLPQTGSVIGAIIRDASVLFPHGSDSLLAGDRVIIFVESRRAALVEKVL